MDRQSEGLISSRSDAAQAIIFATHMTSAKSDYYLRGDPVSLIITNIPSFKGGRANPWMESDKEVIALRDKRQQSIKRVEDNFQEQSISDGMLEISVASNLANLVLDKSRRLGQSEGPFEIKFSDEEGDKKDFVHYLQIDGEFMKVLNLSTLTFRLAQNLEEGSLNMLERIYSGNQP